MSSDPITIGASDVSTILGLNPWGDIWDTWARLRGLVPRYGGGNDATERGHILEPALLARYALDHGVQVIPGPSLSEDPIRHPIEDWAHARPDGTAVLIRPDHPGATWLLEVKTTRWFGDEWGPDGSAEIPPWYAAQVAWQMWVCQQSRTDLIAFATRTDERRTYILHRDGDLEGRLVAQVRRWYHHHVIGGHPPEVDGSSGAGRVLAAMFEARDVAYVASQIDLAAVAELRSVRASLARLEETRRLLEQRLQAAMGDATTLEDGEGNRLATWRPRKGAGRLDLRRLRRDHPDLCRTYEQPGEPGRTFRLESTR